MKRPFFLNFSHYLGKPPPYLWSRGWYGIADQCGDGSISYRVQRTERRVRSLKNLIGKSGLFWLRLGSSAWHKGRPSDVIVFADQVLGRLGGGTVLVTSDGDLSVPSELPESVVVSILSEPNIVAWFTQNYDGTFVHRKLRPIPVGLDLHSWSGGVSIRPHRKSGWFRSAQIRAIPTKKRTLKVWSDVHFKSFPGRHGDPRRDLQEGIASGRLWEFVDTPVNRLSQQEVWSHYGSYLFVLSLPGSAVEAHRTWEALALGAIIVTVHTSLDKLLSPYRVVFIDQKKQNWWMCLANTDWLDKARSRGLEGKPLDLSWEYWNKVVREPLEKD